MSQEIEVNAGTKITLQPIIETEEVTQLQDDDVLAIGDGLPTKHITYGNFKAPLEALVNQSIIGSMTPDGSPSGEEEVGQSYRVDNKTGAVLVFPNFLTNVSDGSGGVVPVQMAADERSGYLVKNADGWAYSDNTAEADLSGLVPKTDITNDPEAADPTKVLGAALLPTLALNGGSDKTLQQVDVDLNGGDVSVGIQDSMDTYTSTNGTPYTRINNIPIPVGKISTLDIKLNVAGSFRIGIFQKIDASHMKALSIISLTGVVGLNNFVDGSNFSNFENTLDGAYLGIILDGDARVYSKTLALGTYVTGETGEVEGDIINPSLSNSQIAIAVTIPVGGAIQDIEEVKQSLEDMQAQLDDSVKKEDIITKPSSNRADPKYIVKGQYYINSAGSKSNTTDDWHVLRLPVVAGEIMTIGRLDLPSGPTYYSFFNSSDVQIAGAKGTILAANLPFTLPETTEGGFLYLNTKRPADDISVYEKLTINEGSELLPYEEPREIIQTIDGKRVPSGGGTSTVQSSQDLTDFPKYTGNDGKGVKILSNGLTAADFVEQNTDVTFNTVNMSGFSVANLPSGASQPVGLMPGDAWVNTTSNTINVAI